MRLEAQMERQKVLKRGNEQIAFFSTLAGRRDASGHFFVMEVKEKELDLRSSNLNSLESSSCCFFVRKSTFLGGDLSSNGSARVSSTYRDSDLDYSCADRLSFPWSGVHVTLVRDGSGMGREDGLCEQGGPFLI